MQKNILNKNDNERRFSYCKFTIGEEKQIIESYLNGSSMTQVGREFHCDPTTVKNILKAYDIQSRNLSEARRNYLNYTLNEDIFETIDNPDKAYWLGVMYSDGYISKVKYTNKFGLAVQMDDQEWLEKFKEFLNYNGDIRCYMTGKGSYKEFVPYVRLLIGNNKIVSDLEKLGVVEHKTKIINKLPDIPYLDDFIRGYIDGDGSLVKRTPRLIICGNKEFLEDIAKYFNLKYSIYQDKSIYNIQYNAKETTYLEKRLYKDAHYYLQRKYEIAQRSFNSPLTLEDVMENPE